MFSYLLGWIKYFFYKKVSFLSFITDTSIIDKKSAVYRFVKIRKSEIGAYSYIGNNSDLNKVIIGRFCSIADYCKIGLPSHNLSHLSTSPIFTESKNGTKSSFIKKNINCAVLKQTKIGNDVWIGSRVLIKDGVSIGNGAVIGAGAVVVKDVPPYAIVGGVPAKIIKYRFSNEVIEKLQEIQWWNFSDDKLINNISLFQMDNITIDLLEKFK